MNKVTEQTAKRRFSLWWETEAKTKILPELQKRFPGALSEPERSGVFGIPDVHAIARNEMRVEMVFRLVEAAYIAGQQWEI